SSRQSPRPTHRTRASIPSRYPQPTALYTLSLHDALPIYEHVGGAEDWSRNLWGLLAFTLWYEHHVESPRSFAPTQTSVGVAEPRSEEHTSELQSRGHLVCRLLLEKKKKKRQTQMTSTLVF